MTAPDLDPARLEELAEALLSDTDLLTPNHDGTPECYVIEAENVPQLIERIITLHDTDARAEGAAQVRGEWHWTREAAALADPPTEEGDR